MTTDEPEQPQTTTPAPPDGSSVATGELLSLAKAVLEPLAQAQTTTVREQAQTERQRIATEGEVLNNAIRADAERHARESTTARFGLAIVVLMIAFAAGAYFFKGDTTTALQILGSIAVASGGGGIGYALGLRRRGREERQAADQQE